MSYPEESSTSLTLAEAISQLRAADDPTGEITAAMSSVAAQAFEQHDAVHVLFGCGTTVQDEIAAHVWMALGTTAKISETHKAVASQEHRKVLSGIGHAKLVGIWLLTLPRIIGIATRSLRMKKRIAFEQIEQLKEQPISVIRAEHGITI